MSINQKITELDPITWANLADEDQFPVVDVSDTSMSASGTTKKIARSEIALAAAAAVTTHEADTTNVHGIADTSTLVTTATLAPYLTTTAAPELIRDTIGSALVAGANITITVNDAGDTITIAATSSGVVASDAIFDAKGDLPVGTGADAAARLAVGPNGTSPIADSNTTTGLRYVGNSRTKAPTGTGVGFYLPDTCATTNVAPQTSAAPQAAVWWPIWVPRRCTPTLAVSCWTAEAGSTLRFSTWANDEATFRPATGGLIEDLGTVSGATTGVRSVTCATPLNPGWNWIGVWASNNTTVRWSRFSGSLNANLMGDSAVNDTRIVFGWGATALDYSSAWNTTLPTLTAYNGTANGQSVVPCVHGI